jgi:hypothetical protein
MKSRIMYRQALGDAELPALPQDPAVERPCAGVAMTVGIYHRSHPDGFEVIVAQAKLQILFPALALLTRRFASLP